MSASGDVIKQVRLDRLDEFKRALPEQIALALALAKDDVTHFALTMTSLTENFRDSRPVSWFTSSPLADTGRLRPGDERR